MTSVTGGVTPSPFSLDKDSVRKVLGNSKEVLVYGFGHAHYTKVSDELKKGLGNIQKVFDWSIGNPQLANKSVITTALGQTMEQISFEESPEGRTQTARLCKAGITNLILENYKRHKRGQEPIQLLFCVSSNTADPSFASTAESISSREPTKNAVITHKELRRLYKLCKELEGSKDPELILLSEIAKKSVKMVSVNQKPSGDYELAEVPPMWEDPNWNIEWQKRLTLRPMNSTQVAMHRKWRRELINRTKIFNASEKFHIHFQDEDIQHLSIHFLEKLYDVNQFNITDCKDFKKALFSDDKHKSDFDAAVKLGAIPSGLKYEDFLNDPIFEVIYEEARKAYC